MLYVDEKTAQNIFHFCPRKLNIIGLIENGKEMLQTINIKMCILDGLEKNHNFRKIFLILDFTVQNT